MHQRRQFLEAIKTQLKAVDGFPGVWIQRIGPQRNIYPSITLYSDQESIETLTIHSPARPQDRVLTISIVAWIKGSADDEKAEQDMDKAAVLIEQAVTKPVGADDMALIATDFIVDEEEAEIHAVTLTYTLFYTSTEFSPSV